MSAAITCSITSTKDSHWGHILRAITVDIKIRVGTCMISGYIDLVQYTLTASAPKSDSRLPIHLPA